MLLAAAIVASASTVASALLPGSSTTVPLDALSIIAGMANAAIFLAWSRVIAWQGNQRFTWLVSSLSTLMGLGLAVIAVALPPQPRLVTIALLPIVSVVCLRAALSMMEKLADGEASSDQADCREDSPQRTPVPMGVLLCCVLFCAPMSMMRMGSGAFAATDAGIWQLMFAADVLLLGLVLLLDLLRPRLRRMRLFYRLVVPCLAGGMLMLPVVLPLGNGLVAGICILFGQSLFLIYVYYVLGCLYPSGSPASGACFALAAIAIDSGMLVGGAVSMLASGLALHVTTFALCASYLVILVGTIASPKTFAWLSALDLVESTESARGGRRFALSQRASVIARCGEIAGRYELSAREEEVLQFLVRGYSVKSMAAELMLSENTVKTHKNHLYVKLGVHTRDEMMAIVEGSRA